MMSELRQVSGAPKIDPPLTPVQGTPIDHPSAWKAADFKAPADYTIELDATHLRDIERAVRQIKSAGLGLGDLQREHFEVPSLRPVIDEIRRQIADGRGFVVLRVHIRDRGFARLPDRDVFTRAAEDERIVVTFDLDFGEIVGLAGAAGSGVVLLRLRLARQNHLRGRLRAAIAAREPRWKLVRSFSSKTLASVSGGCRRGVERKRGRLT